MATRTKVRFYCYHKKKIDEGNESPNGISPCRKLFFSYLRLLLKFIKGSIDTSKSKIKNLAYNLLLRKINKKCHAISNNNAAD